MATRLAKNWKHRDLLKLPDRKWGAKGIYDSIYLVPSRHMHDSGWMTIAIVGLIKNEPKEIAAYPDAIEWVGDLKFLKTDCTWPSGVIHCWSRYAKFEISDALSSVDITLLPKEMEG